MENIIDNFFKSIDYISIINKMECSVDKIIKDVLLSQSNIDSNYLVYQDYNTICYLIKEQMYNDIFYIHTKDKIYYNTICLNKVILEKINSLNDIQVVNHRITIFATNALQIAKKILMLKVYNLNLEFTIEEFKKRILGQIINTQIQYRSLLEKYSMSVIEEEYIMEEYVDRCVFSIIDNSVTKQIHILLNNILAKINYSKADKKTVYMIYEEIDCIRNLILQKYFFLYYPKLYLSEYPDTIFYNTAISIIQFMKERVDNRLHYYNIDFNLNDMTEFKEACANFAIEFELEFSELKEYIINENNGNEEY